MWPFKRLFEYLDQILESQPVVQAVACRYPADNGGCGPLAAFQRYVFVVAWIAAGRRFGLANRSC